MFFFLSKQLFEFLFIWKYGNLTTEKWPRIDENLLAKRAQIVVALLFDDQLYRVQIFSSNFTPAKILCCVPPSHVTSRRYQYRGNKNPKSVSVCSQAMSTIGYSKVFWPCVLSFNCYSLVYFSRLSFGFVCGNALLKGSRLSSSLFVRYRLGILELHTNIFTYLDVF